VGTRKIERRMVECNEIIRIVLQCNGLYSASVAGSRRETSLMFGVKEVVRNSLEC